MGHRRTVGQPRRGRLPSRTGAWPGLPPPIHFDGCQARRTAPLRPAGMRGDGKAGA
jgi:hypothetical protein